MSEKIEDRWTDRLSEYLDGELSRREHADLERHLESCAACREALDDLRSLMARAGALEDRPPQEDLWPAIASRLESPREPGWKRLGAWLTAPRFAFSLPQLAGAALVVVVLSGGGMWALLRATKPASPVATGPGRAPATTSAATPLAGRALPSGPAAGEAAGPVAASAPATELQLASYDFKRYDSTIDELQNVIQQHRAELDTSTVRVIEQNLALIDRAIGDARRALVADPSNPYLNGHLAQQLQRKVRLLQRATDLVAVRQS